MDYSGVEDTKMVGYLFGIHPSLEEADGIIFCLLAVVREGASTLADMGCIPLVDPLVEALP